MNQVPVTAEGKAKMQEQLAKLEAQVPVVTTEIEEAREKGDLKENAEYHAAREKLALLNGEIADLKSRLASAFIVDSSQIDQDTIAFGAKVDLEDEDGDVETWELVGQGEDDALENKILTTSPMGQALLGHRVDDAVEVEAPIGKLLFTVKSISY
jgi:transcription elongation factor GreA